MDMPKVFPLVGTYKQKGTHLENLTAEGNGLIISERAKITRRKPIPFLLHVDSQGNRTYVSSLYQADNCHSCWTFELGGTWYTMSATGPDTYTVTYKAGADE